MGAKKDGGQTTGMRSGRGTRLPPPLDAFPKPDESFQRIKGGYAPGVRPRNAESNAALDAVKEVRGFADWALTFGKLAPPQEVVAEVFDAASQWSTMVHAAEKWAAFASMEEGVAWTAARELIARLKPVFDKAVLADPSLATHYPKLTALLGARSEITRKGNNTRAARKKAEEEKKKSDPKP